MSSWETIGTIGVDAGLCWVGDPCYIMHTADGKLPTDLGRSWDGFCDKVHDKDTTQFHYDLGHAGLGVCVSTGYGDGTYPVQVRRNSEGRIAELRVKFI